MKNEELCQRRRGRGKGRKKKIPPVIKQCSMCFVVKDMSSFYKKQSKCISCLKIIREENKEKTSLRMKEYHVKNRERKKEYERNKYKSDINNKLSLLLRGRIRHAMKGGQKPASAVKDMGCTVQELRVHLESQFKDGMTWENHGVFGWHIDHKKPLAMFNLANRESFLQACHYTNLQPLWWVDNVKKGSRYID